jgi:hypothetical protein
VTGGVEQGKRTRVGTGRPGARQGDRGGWGGAIREARWDNQGGVRRGNQGGQRDATKGEVGRGKRTREGRERGWGGWAIE